MFPGVIKCYTDLTAGRAKHYIKKISYTTATKKLGLQSTTGEH
jgi:hypothetical protein